MFLLNRGLSLQLLNSIVSVEKSAVSVTAASFSECNFPLSGCCFGALFFGFLQFYWCYVGDFLVFILLVIYRSPRI